MQESSFGPGLEAFVSRVFPREIFLWASGLRTEIDPMLALHIE